MSLIAVRAIALRCFRLVNFAAHFMTLVDYVTYLGKEPFNSVESAHLIEYESFC